MQTYGIFAVVSTRCRIGLKPTAANTTALSGASVISKEDTTKGINKIAQMVN